MIANRGEIAVRIIRACRNLGIRSVAVYSKEDAKSLHVQLADQRICIGEGPARNSYLNMDRIIAAAENMGADAIHPGFGFLSENSEFVRKCKENGITFIGPDADVIDKMGNKSHARKTMMDAGVPVVPGTKEPVYDAETGKKLAEEIGYPVMIKASSGGGGKGMRVAANEDEFEFQFNMAQRESANAFGDDTMYIERFVENPRHVEIQIMADSHGNVVALGERDCSVQRNHQKLIEESPSPAIDEETQKEATEELNAEEKVNKELAEAQKTIEEQHDKYLRLSAEFDNYRKRTMKEKAELIKNGGEKAITAILPILDDLERAVKTSETSDDVKAMREGIELIYNKFLKVLNQEGLQKIETDGENFDTDYHEAIALVPAPSEEKKGKILDCVQTGYKLNDKVIRHAKVVVAQ